MNQKKKVLFLCTGNSCRSQMAEAVVNAQLNNSWRAFSAGTQPAGYVHPKALQVLAEIGITHHGRSRHVREFLDFPFDLVVTVCDEAAANCPVWLGPGKRVHFSFPDPAQALGSDDEITAVFRQTRDDIARRVGILLKSHTE